MSAPGGTGHSATEPSVRAVVGLEFHFIEGADGAHYSDRYDYQFWRRYLEGLDEVVVLARSRRVSQIPDGWRQVEGDRVTFWNVPDYTGPWQYLRRRREVVASIESCTSTVDCGVLRVPGTMGQLAVRGLVGQNKPFALEVVGDPWDVLTVRGTGSLLAPLLRRRARWRLRRMCLASRATSYVTSEALQRRYPPGATAFSTHYSSVELPDEGYAPGPRSYSKRDPLTRPAWSLLVVGSLAQHYKGIDVLLKAISLCVDQGLDVQLEVVGGGRYLEEYKELARRLGLEGRVTFRGRLPSGEAVRARLEAADLFVLPSRTEGLPRAVIEAMAMGLPCIATNAGGIAELLDGDVIVPSDDHEALCGKIQDVLTDPERLGAMSAANLEKAGEFRADVLRKRRTEFYEFVRSIATADPGNRIGSP